MGHNFHSHRCPAMHRGLTSYSIITVTLLTTVPSQVALFPSSCIRRVPPRPLRGGMGHGKRCRAVARTPEAHPSTYPTTPNTRINMPYASSCPDALACSCCRAQARSPCSRRCCSGGRDARVARVPLKLGSLVELAWEADAGRKTRPRRPTEPPRTPRRVVWRMRAPGVGGLVLWVARAGAHGGLS